MNKYKQNLIKETRNKANSLILGLQEPLLSEFSKANDLRNIAIDISQNLNKIKVLLEEESFNNKNGEKNG